MADAETGVFPVGEGYGLDLAAAFAAHGPSRSAIADYSTNDTYKRTMVRTALILARPTKR